MASFSSLMWVRFVHVLSCNSDIITSPLNVTIAFPCVITGGPNFVVGTLQSVTMWAKNTGISSSHLSIESFNSRTTCKSQTIERLLCDSNALGTMGSTYMCTRHMHVHVACTYIHTVGGNFWGAGFPDLKFRGLMSRLWSVWSWGFFTSFLSWWFPINFAVVHRLIVLDKELFNQSLGPDLMFQMEVCISFFCSPESARMIY